MVEEQMGVGRSLAETPTWSVATVITAMVAVGFLIQRYINNCRKWLVKTKRKALLAALEKIKEEMMLFGLLSLSLGHWTIWVARICVKSSVFSARFYPCAEEAHKESKGLHNYCPKGHEPFASFESLEQLHRLLIVLGITHVSYSFFTVALAMIKIYSWRSWESQAMAMAIQNLQDSSGVGSKNMVIRRQSTFVFHHTSHPWSKNKVLIWMLCFIRQFWSSINRADYMALRLGFITNHNLHLSYDFHNYMLRSMDEEFRCIVSISVPLWGYAILCIFVNFHGTNAYFWLSFIPAILILLVGTKMHHIVSQLALEVMDLDQSGNQLKPRDELFWFRQPKLLLWLIQLISFQNAFEMATFLWSLWEIKGHSCFMKNRAFLIIRLTSGIIFQSWCSYNTFPLYVIITQMGSKFKKALIAENVRESLHGWIKRVKDKPKHAHYHPNLISARSNTSLESMANKMEEIDDVPTSSMAIEEIMSSVDHSDEIYAPQSVHSDEIYAPQSDDSFLVSPSSGSLFDRYGDDDSEEHVAGP
ncbi:hypothetical protein AAC387_Pa07g3600 [Persea americana]